jgi:hypothetical protein
VYKKCENFANVEGRYFLLEDEKQFIQAVGGQGFIVILDNANGDEVHLPTCDFVKLESFSKKVIENKGIQDAISGAVIMMMHSIPLEQGTARFA